MDSIEQRMEAMGTRARHGFVSDGQPYFIASSGYAAIITSQPVAGEYVDAPPERVSSYCEFLRVGAEHEVTGDSLRSFAGPIVPEPEECSLCDGYGKIECSECRHERDCEDCDGSGNEDGTPDRPQVAVTVAGALISRHLLAELISDTTDAVFHIGSHARGRGRYLIVRGDNWTGLLMGLIDGSMESTAEFKPEPRP